MPLRKEVGLGPGHIVLDWDPVGTQPPEQPLPTFGPCLLWSNCRPSQQLLSSCTNGRPKTQTVVPRALNSPGDPYTESEMSAKSAVIVVFVTELQT